ncbi:ATP-binding protein [Streptomyces sp. NPDC005474]|uniref:ATP-binding protein n=1 Tax=Streptomyces sp. NPDC005474 TaxID=3154878 RepID=UPI0034513B86
MFVLTATPASVGMARRKVRELLDLWNVGPDTCDNALLVTSELVTNALTHAASERVVCRLYLSAERLYIEVEDENRGRTLPARRRPEPDEQCGRGLLLVGVLTSDWGVRDAPDGSGRVVWAELPAEQAELPEAPSPTPTPAVASVPGSAAVPAEPPAPVVPAVPAGTTALAAAASAETPAPVSPVPAAAPMPAPMSPPTPPPPLPPTPPTSPAVQAATPALWHPHAPHRIRPIPHSAEGIASHGPYGTQAPHPPYSRS